MTKAWWQEPVRMLRVDYVPNFASVKHEDFDALAKSRKEDWQINCEWIIGTLSFGGDGHLTTFAADGFDRCPGFEDFDYLRSYTPYAHKYGIKVISYLNVHWYTYEFADQHPDWEQISGKKMIPYGRLYPLYGKGTTFCINTPWRDWAFKLVQEAIKTGIDGIFLDGPALYPGCCYCPSCQEQFQKKYGQPIPQEDWTDPLWNAFMDFRDDSMVQFLAEARQAAHSVNPDAVIFMNTGSGGWGPINWHTALDSQRLAPFQNFNGSEAFFHYGKSHFPYEALMTGKYVRSAGIPPIVFTHYMNGSWHYLNLPAGEVQYALAQTFALNANPWWALTVHSLKSQPQSPQPIREFCDFQEKHKDLYIDAEPVAEAALLLSRRTGRRYLSTQQELDHYNRPASADEQKLIIKQKGGKAIDWIARKYLCEEIIYSGSRGFFEALTRNHILFDVIQDQHLTPKELAKFRTIVLPDTACLSESEADALRQFVSQGGNLIASFEAGFYDEKGQFTDRLFDLLGIEKADGMFPVMMGDNYYELSEDFLGWNKKSLIERGPYGLKVRPRPGTRTPLQFMEPLESAYQPLKPITDYPGLILSRYGKGQVAYFSEAVGYFYAETGLISVEDRIAGVLRSLNPQPFFRIQAPKSVTAEIYRQTDPDRIVIHLVNNGVDRRPVSDFLPAADLTLTIRTNRQPKQITALRENGKITHAFDSETLTIENVSVSIYEVIVVEF